MIKAVQCPKCGKWVLADEQDNPVPHINPGGSICQIADYTIGNGDADWIKQVRDARHTTRNCQ